MDIIWIEDCQVRPEDMMQVITEDATLQGGDKGVLVQANTIIIHCFLCIHSLSPPFSSNFIMARS